MPNVSRPYLLPLSKAARIGLPFHGPCKNGKLTLPDASQKDYTQPSGADLTYVEHPRAAAPVKTTAEQAFDTARNYQWLPYAYVSGSERYLGNQTLRDGTSTSIDGWLYCSTNRTFLIKCQKDQVGTLVVLIVSAKEFGRLGVDQSAYVEIGRPFFYVKDYDNNNLAQAVSYRGITHDKTGAITVINFNGGTGNFAESFGLAAAIKLTISGDALADLEVTGTVLAVGSQIATVEPTVNSIDSFVYAGTVTVCGSEGTDCTIESNVWNIRDDGDVRVTVTEASYDPTFPATYHAAYTYSFYSNEPLEGQFVDTVTVDAKVYFYVLPDGTVSSIDAVYKTGSEVYLTASIPQESASGTYDWTVGNDAVFTDPVVVAGSVTKLGWDGLSATVGGQSWSVANQEDCVTTVKIRYQFSHYYDTSFDWSDTYLVGKPFCDYSSVTDHAITSGTYQPQWISENEEESVNVSGYDKPNITYYCNNILDVYHFQEYGNKYHYLYSLTISGKTFSRFRDRVGDTYRLYPAIWDPRTDTVTLGDPGDALSII